MSLMKEFSTLSVRAPVELRKEIEHFAHADARSISALIVKVMQDWCAAQRANERETPKRKSRAE